MTLTRVRIPSDRHVEVLEKVMGAVGAKGWTLSGLRERSQHEGPSGGDGHLLICDRILLRLSRD